MMRTKIRIIEKAAHELEEQIQVAQNAANEAQTDANSHVGAMESRYDTFKEEAQYLSAAQRVRAAELARLLTRTRELLERLRREQEKPETVQLGSLVTILDENEEESTYLILCNSLSQKFFDGDTAITVIGDGTPIAKALMGLGAGDEVEINLPQKKIIGTVRAIE